MKVRILAALAISGLLGIGSVYAAAPVKSISNANQNAVQMSDAAMNEPNDNPLVTESNDANTPKPLAMMDENSTSIDPADPIAAMQDTAAPTGQPLTAEGSLPQPVAATDSLDLADNSGSGAPNADMQSADVQNTDQNNVGSMNNVAATDNSNNNGSNDEMNADTATGDDDY